MIIGAGNVSIEYRQIVSDRSEIYYAKLLEADKNVSTQQFIDADKVNKIGFIAS